MLFIQVERHHGTAFAPSWLLRCPVCRLDLTALAGKLACPTRHSFDLAGDGYVNVLPGKRRRPPQAAAASPSVSAAGHFGLHAGKIATRLRQAGAMPAGELRRVLDAGCETGFRLARMAPALGSATIQRSASVRARVGSSIVRCYVL